jgi:hypothetical protein
MSAKDYVSRLRAKKFSKHFLVVGGVLVAGAVVIAVANSNEQKKEEAEDAARHQKIIASNVFNGIQPPTVSQAEVVTKNMTNYIDNQKAVNQQMADRIALLESQNMEYQQAVMEAESNTFAINDKLALLNTQQKQQAESSAIASQKPQFQIIEGDINSDTGDDNSFTEEAKNAASNTSNNSNLDSNNKSGGDNAKDSSNVSTYIPSNTFVKGEIVSALSANTGGNASTDPTPILVRITNFAQLPNQFKSNLRSCMVGASGWGDLSTERVKARLTQLSCVLKDGRIIDIPVDGYLSGEDGRAGIRGMLVQHSGSLVAKATMAGFVQGIGAIGQAMGQTQTITPLGGVTTTISPQQALIAGAGSGVSQAGSTLSQYYLQQLQQISPSIEISSGRHVTVIFTKGIELKLPINDQSSLDNSPLPIKD